MIFSLLDSIKKIAKFYGDVTLVIFWCTRDNCKPDSLSISSETGANPGFPHNKAEKITYLIELDLRKPLVVSTPGKIKSWEFT
jgi:hypothetical protein